MANDHDSGNSVASDRATRAVDVPRRETVYYRLHADGHRQRWQEAVTDPLLEFRPA